MSKLVLQAPVYKYFEFISMNDKQSCLYNCLLCVALKKKIAECRSMNSTTSNLRGHLSKHHPSAFEDFEKLENDVPITVAKKRKLDFSSSTQLNLVFLKLNENLL